MRAFCLLNGHDLAYESVDAAERFVLEVAAGDLEVAEIADWIAARLTNQTR